MEAVIAGKWIDANVRLRLTANRTYGLIGESRCRRSGISVNQRHLEG